MYNACASGVVGHAYYLLADTSRGYDPLLPEPLEFDHDGRHTVGKSIHVAQSFGGFWQALSTSNVNAACC